MKRYYKRGNFQFSEEVRVISGEIAAIVNPHKEGDVEITKEEYDLENKRRQLILGDRLTLVGGRIKDVR